MNRGFLNIDQIEDRFFVHGRMEMLDILTDLLYRSESIVLFAHGLSGATPVSLLEARMDGLVFMLPDDFDRTLAGPCMFVAFPEGIRVQFQCDIERQESDEGGCLLLTAMPNRLARVQRQESFRTWIDPDEAPEVALYSADGDILGLRALHDLSAGGLGIVVQGEWGEQAAARIARVRFSLGAFGEVDCAVAVRHSTHIEANRQYRIGMSFCGLGTELRARIQRYVTATEYERRNSQTKSQDRTG